MSQNFQVPTHAYDGNPSYSNILSRSSSCSSLDIAASPFSYLQAAEMVMANANPNMMAFNNMSFAGMGLQPPAAPAAMTQPEITMDDVQRFISSRLMNQQAPPPPPAMPVPQFNSPNLQELSNQFHEMQHMLDLSRPNEMASLMHTQQQLQQQPQGNSFQVQQQQGKTFGTFTELTLPQNYNPISSRNELRSSHASINPISLGNDSRSSHANIASEALLKIWKEDQDARNNVGLSSKRLSEHNKATQDVEGEVSHSMSTNEIMFVPTKVTSPSSFTKGDQTGSPANAEFNRCRTNSISSFDALLSAVGDDLVELDKAKKASFSNSCDPVSKAPSLQHLAEIFGDVQVTTNASSNASASWNAITPELAAIRDMATQQVVSQGQNPLLAQWADNHLHIQRGQSQENGKEPVKRISLSDTSNCDIELAIKRLSSALSENPYLGKGTVEDLPDDPRKDLDKFLSDYGDEGKKAQESLLIAIEDSESSLAKIHEWDRNMGHRKCSNRTVVKTRRSRAKIKAFLQGVRPPKEPKPRQKRSKIA